jgi:hypothetical protein
MCAFKAGVAALESGPASARNACLVKRSTPSGKASAFHDLQPPPFARHCRGRQIIGSFEVVCDEAQDSQLLQRLRKEAAAAAAAATHAPVPPPASPARQRALLQGGVRPKAVEPDKKLLLR